MAAQQDSTDRTPGGEDRDLADYSGQVVLVANSASQCGLTPQYDGLQQLYSDYRDRGLMVLGFPCNQLANQEPGAGRCPTPGLPPAPDGMSPLDHRVVRRP